MDFKTLSAARYSLRKFSSRPVGQEELDLILEAGRNAPTAHNYQPQRIFVLRSPTGALSSGLPRPWRRSTPAPAPGSIPR